jgi:fumarylacetoacetase
MYWSMSQQLTHHTSNGCRVNSDMMGSGTISDLLKIVLVLCYYLGVENPQKMSDNTERKFINDNDTVYERFCQTVMYALVLRISSKYYLLCTRK